MQLTGDFFKYLVYININTKKNTEQFLICVKFLVDSINQFCQLLFTDYLLLSTTFLSNSIFLSFCKMNHLIIFTHLTNWNLNFWNLQLTIISKLDSKPFGPFFSNSMFLNFCKMNYLIIFTHLTNRNLNSWNLQLTIIWFQNLILKSC